MCDYSLMHAKSRPAVVGEKLVVRNFGTGTRGFAPADSIDNVAVCLVPGTELAFARPINSLQPWYEILAGKLRLTNYDNKATVAIFRQINKDMPNTHHDALETPDGRITTLTSLMEGQEATVLQLPAAPKNKTEEREQTRLEVVG